MSVDPTRKTGEVGLVLSVYLVSDTFPTAFTTPGSGGETTATTNHVNSEGTSTQTEPRSEPRTVIPRCRLYCEIWIPRPRPKRRRASRGCSGREFTGLARHRSASPAAQLPELTAPGEEFRLPPIVLAYVDVRRNRTGLRAQQLFRRRLIFQRRCVGVASCSGQ